MKLIEGFETKAGGYLALLVVMIVAFLLYSRVLDFGYVWDDSILFVNKSDLLNNDLSWSLLSKPVLAGTTYLRPMVFLTFFAEFHLFGQHPYISHLVNLSFFICNTILLFLLAREMAFLKLKKQPNFLAFLASIIYLTHPALIESTAWISGRFDLVVTFFILLTSYVYVSRLSSFVKAILVAPLMFCGLLSKELGIVFPFLMFCLWMSIYSDGFSSIKSAVLCFFKANFYILFFSMLFVGFYFYLRVSSVNGLYNMIITQEYFVNVICKEYLPIKTLGFYFLESFAPFHYINILHPLNDFENQSYFESFMNGVAVLVSLYVCWVAFVYRTAASWLFIAYLTCLALVLNIIPLSIVGNIGHERFMTTALAFLAIAIVMVDWQWFENKLNSVAVHVSLSKTLLPAWLLYSVFTVSTVLPFWSSELQLWNWAFKYNRNSDLAHYNYLYAAYMAGKFDLIDKQVDEENKNSGGLSVPSQIIYANRLVAVGNREGLRYLEGVIYALPKFHDDQGGRSKIDGFLLTHNQLGGVYSTYASALIMFGCDPHKALAYTKIAEWYLDDGEKLPLYYQKSIIYSILGDHDQSVQIWNSQAGTAFYNKEILQAQAKAMLVLYKKNAVKHDGCAA
jgi:hypothetical protein